MVRGDTSFLTTVMDTIASLKDSKGSPPDKILDKIIYQSKTPLKNASLCVKKALKTGLKAGLIKENGGKFKLGLGSKDYAIFKSFRQKGKGAYLPITECRRRRRRKSRSRSRRRKRGRRRADGILSDLVEGAKTFEARQRRQGRRKSDILKIDDLKVDYDANLEPMDKGKRRRRRRGKKRRRRGRRRGLEDKEQGVQTSDSKESSISSHDESKTSKTGIEDTRNPNENRNIDPEPPTPRFDDENVSDHCIHNFHHEAENYGHPPQGHYGGEFYD